MTLDLSKLGASLGAVRQALGATGEHDSAMDERIRDLSPEFYVAAYSQWHLGSRAWGRDFYNLTHEVDEAIVWPDDT